MGLFLLLVAAACGSSDPPACNGKGSYSGAETCGKIKSAILAKCAGSGVVFDCDRYLANTSCSSSRRFCGEGVDKAVANVNGAVDCTAALKVQLGSYCFDRISTGRVSCARRRQT
jgi:hypothetical protein